MANVVITSDSERIYFVFNDYSDQAGVSSGNWAKFDISCELNNGDTDLFVFDDGNNLFRLSYNSFPPALLVDSVDGVAPISNADLKTKIDAILSAGGGGSAWGGITGTLSDQTDLQSALDAKQDEPTGTPDGTKYLRDDNTWQPVSGGSGLSQAQVLTRLTFRI